MLKYHESSEGLIHWYHRSFKGVGIVKHKIFDVCILQCRADLGA
jgi:hypothetical protein